MLVSRPHPSGLVCFIALPDDASIVMRFNDDDSTRDQTGWAADLLLVGLLNAAQRAEIDRVIAPERVEVGEVLLTGAELDDVAAGILNPPTGEGNLIDWATAVELITVGIDAQITEGVASEVAATPAPWNVPAESDEADEQP